MKAMIKKLCHEKSFICGFDLIKNISELDYILSLTGLDSIFWLILCDGYYGK